MPTFSGSWETGDEGWFQIVPNLGGPANQYALASYRGQSDYARTGSFIVSPAQGSWGPTGAFYPLPPEANEATVTISYWALCITTPGARQAQLTLWGRNATSGSWTSISSVTAPPLVPNVWTPLSYTVTTTGDYLQYGVSGDAGLPRNACAMDDWSISYEPTTSTYVKDAGVWKPAAKYGRAAGVWKPAATTVRDAGVWKGV